MLKHEAEKKSQKLLASSKINHLVGREIIKLEETMPHDIKKFKENCNPTHYYLAINNKQYEITAGEFKVI